MRLPHDKKEGVKRRVESIFRGKSEELPLLEPVALVNRHWLAECKASLCDDYRKVTFIKTWLMSDRDLSIIMRRNQMPHVNLLRHIVFHDHRGQQLKSVARAIKVNLKLEQGMDLKMRGGRLLQAFGIRAVSNAKNRFSRSSLEQIVESSWKSLKVLELQHVNLSSKVLANSL